MIQYLVATIIDLLVGVAAIRKKRTKTTLSLMFVALCAASWSFELYLLTILKNADLLNLCFHIFRVGMFFIPTALCLFSWSLISKKSPKSFYLFVAPFIACSFSLSVANLFFFPSGLKLEPGGYTPVVDTIFVIFSIEFISAVVISMGLCVYSHLAATTREKQRIKWIFITYGVALVTGLSSIFLMPSGFYLSKLVGATSNIVFVSMLLYSTIQHNLMEVRLALSVGLARILLLSIFCWMYFALVSSFTLSLDTTGGAITLLVFFLAVMEAYPRLLRHVVPNAKKLFSAETFDFDLEVSRLGNEFSRCINAVELYSVVNRLSKYTLNAGSFELFLSEQRNNTNINELQSVSYKVLGQSDKKPKKINSQTLLKANTVLMLDEADASLRQYMVDNKYYAVVPVRVSDELVGALMFGAPNGRRQFGYNDIRVFEWLMAELPKVCSRLVELAMFEKELENSKKTLSMLNIMNHYHHDIKAPLSIIDGVVTNELYDREKQRQVILEQVSLGSKLIATMSKLLKGERSREVGQVAIDEVIKDCLLIFNHVLSRAEVNIEDGAMVYGDADDLKILFINIIKNAAEASRAEEKIAIQVKAWKDENAVWVSIVDNGEGMDQQQLDGLWTSGKTTKKTGSGIGMQAIKRIADEHNATIKMASHLGKGTDITLSFPLSA